MYVCMYVHMYARHMNSITYSNFQACKKHNHAHMYGTSQELLQQMDKLSRVCGLIRV